MQRGSGGESKSLKPFAEQFSVHFTKLWLGKLHLPYEIRPSREVERHARERFIHGNIFMAITHNTFTLAQRLGNGFANGNAGIFGGMVVIDMQIAFSTQFDVN